MSEGMIAPGSTIMLVAIDKLSLFTGTESKRSARAGCLEVSCKTPEW